MKGIDMTSYSEAWHYEYCMGEIVCKHEDPHCPHYHTLKGETVCNCPPTQPKLKQEIESHE